MWRQWAASCRGLGILAGRSTSSLCGTDDVIETSAISVAAQHASQVLAFVALEPAQRCALIEECGWASRYELEAGSTGKQLLSELEESLPHLAGCESWLEAMKCDTLHRELEALLQLMFVVTGAHQSENERLFSSISAMKTEPEWLLVHRLAAELTRLLGVSVAISVAQVPALICGEEFGAA